MDFKNSLAKLISQKTGIDAKEVFDLMEIPKEPSHGDYAFPCFILSKKLKKPPQIIAKDLKEELGGDWFTSNNIGPYLNFKIENKFLSEVVLKKIKEPLQLAINNDLTVGIESPAPNSNKPLHLGHLRNMLLGLSLKNIYEKTGKKTIWFDIVNDRGTHICKSMLAYKLEGENKTPKSVNKKSDHFVGDYYVKFSALQKDNPDLEKKAQEMLQKWENDDEETVALWRRMRDWWLEGARQTYDEYGIKIDYQTFESEIYKEGKKIILDGLNKGLFEKDESGAVFVDLSKQGLGKKYLLRSDGTAIYITQDIYLAKKRFEEHSLDEFSYVVGSEQIYHFKVLFEILKKLGFDFAEKCRHISYGLISLPHGRMKSREGTVVDADDFKENMLELAEVELKERYSNLSVDELNKRREIIATGAINFFILKYDSKKDFTYFPEQSLSFQGESGPYVQYTHARICSILKKQSAPSNVAFDVLNLDIEKQLVNKLKQYEFIVSYASNNSKPSSITNYLLELSQLFNSYYQEVNILKEEPKIRDVRLFLIDKVRIIIKDGLSLLGIIAPEEM